MPNKFERYIVHTLRDDVLRRFFNSMRGRKVFSKMLPDRITAVAVKEKDHVLLCDPRDLVGRSVVVHGNWGRKGTENVVHYLAKRGMLKKHGIAIDLGANIGTQTLYLHLTNYFEKIIAVEASPRNFDLLCANIAINRIHEKIKPLNAAVYTEDGTIDLYLKENDVSGGHSVLGLAGNTKKVEVRALTVSSIIQQEQVSSDDVTFIWMDIEGFDTEILKDIYEVFGSRLPVFFEFSPKFLGNTKAKAFVEFLKASYGHVYTFEGGKAEPTLVKDIDALANIPQIDLLVSKSLQE